LERGLLFWGKLEKKEEEILKERGKKEEVGRTDVFGELSEVHCYCWELWARGSGNRKDSWS
jgi:hypothetical protein